MSHPYRKQPAVNIPEHLLPQIYMEKVPPLDSPLVQHLNEELHQSGLESSQQLHHSQNHIDNQLQSHTHIPGHKNQSQSHPPHANPQVQNQHPVHLPAKQPPSHPAPSQSHPHQSQNHPQNHPNYFQAQHPQNKPLQSHPLPNQVPNHPNPNQMPNQMPRAHTQQFQPPPPNQNQFVPRTYSMDSQNSRGSERSFSQPSQFKSYMPGLNVDTGYQMPQGFTAVAQSPQGSHHEIPNQMPNQMQGYQNFNPNFQMNQNQHPNQQQMQYQNQPQMHQQMPQQHTQPPRQHYTQRNSSNSSLTYSRKPDRDFHSHTSPELGQGQFQQKPARKAPASLAPVQTDRRIVLTLSVPQASEKSPLEARTKSLSSMSKYQQFQKQPYMQPIQQGQITNHSPSLSSSSSTSSSSNNIHHSFSLLSKSRSFTSLSKLSSLSTKKFNSSASLQGKNDRIASTSSLASNRTLVQMSKKPLVYPAMLSRVAKVFRELMFLTINTKDGLEYHDTFTGKMAVDIICRIIRTNDRNLALLLGRSLDSQKFFHDVTYQHRLRDSVHEVYAFSHTYTDVELYEEDEDIQTPKESGVNGVFTILTDCYSPTCSRNRLCYSIACPRRLEQQARLNMKPQEGLKRAVSRLSLHDQDENKLLWHETVPSLVLDKLDKHEKVRQELIYEFIYTERDYVKDLEFMTDFYIMPLRNPLNNIIPEREREAFIRTVFGGVSNLLRLAKSMSEALTRRQQLQKPVILTFADVFLQFVDKFEPFIQYSGNKVFASFEHERQQQVNMRYASFLDAIEKRPESRKQDLSSFLIKGIQRPARYQLLLGGILKNTNPDSPDYENLVKAKEEIEKILVKINIQTGESTDRHKIMVLHRLLGKQTLEEKYNFKLSYNNRIIYQVTLNRKRDNEKIDLYLFEHALLLVKHKIQNKREQYKVFEKPIYLPLLFVNSGYDIPTFRTVLNARNNGSVISDSKAKIDSLNTKLQINFLGLGSQQVHTTLNADDVANQNQVLSQISAQQKKFIAKYDIFSLSKYETRRFTGNNKINCAVPCYGGKKLLYGTDNGVWVSTVRTISMTNNEKICSDPTMVISQMYVTQVEVLVEYSKLLILADKSLYEFDLSCTDSLDHVKNTRSGKLILTHISSFKTGICDGKLIVCCIKQGSNHAINIFEPLNPFDKSKNKNKKYDIREITFSSDPISISFLRTRLCVGCTKGFEILSLEDGKKEPILDEADPSLDFATQKEIVNPLAIHRLGKDFLLSYSEFSFLINRNGWRTKHDWGIFWEGNPTNIALFYPYLLLFELNFVEIRDLESTSLIRALIGENIRFLHSNEHEAMYACEENGYDVIVSIDFLNLKPK